MRIEREITETITAGNLRVSLECDEDGVPVRVTLAQVLSEDEEVWEEAFRGIVDVSILDRICAIADARRTQTNQYAHGYWKVCPEHGRYDADSANKYECPVCSPIPKAEQPENGAA